MEKYLYILRAMDPGIYHLAQDRSRPRRSRTSHPVRPTNYWTMHLHVYTRLRRRRIDIETHHTLRQIADLIQRYWLILTNERHSILQIEIWFAIDSKSSFNCLHDSCGLTLWWASDETFQNNYWHTAIDTCENWAFAYLRFGEVRKELVQIRGYVGLGGVFN